MKKVVYLALMMCMASTAIATAQSAVEINVAAYNVLYSERGSAAEIGGALKSYDFDVVCFSEAPGGTWGNEVAQALGMDYVVVGQYSTAGHDDKYKTIVSKTPLYGYEEVLMADTLHSATRALTRIGGNEFAIYAVHFPFGWRDQAHIDETTGKISAFVDFLRIRERGPAIPILAGDFNFIVSQPDTVSMYFDMHRHAGFAATWSALDIDVTNQGSMVNFVPKNDGLGRVIDHILYKPSLLSPVSGGIIEMERPLSDHKPVWTKFRVVHN